VASITLIGAQQDRTRNFVVETDATTSVSRQTLLQTKVFKVNPMRRPSHGVIFMMNSCFLTNFYHVVEAVPSLTLNILHFKFETTSEDYSSRDCQTRAFGSSSGRHKQDGEGEEEGTEDLCHLHNCFDCKTAIAKEVQVKEGCRFSSPSPTQSRQQCIIFFCIIVGTFSVKVKVTERFRPSPASFVFYSV
jgi:hypothetical protein